MVSEEFKSSLGVKIFPSVDPRAIGVIENMENRRAWVRRDADGDPERSVIIGLLMVNDSQNIR